MSDETNYLETVPGYIEMVPKVHPDFIARMIKDVEDSTDSIKSFLEIAWEKEKDPEKKKAFYDLIQELGEASTALHRARIVKLNDII